MIQTKTVRKHSFTPLRYPGGKTSLLEFFSSVISIHDWQRVNYIEPFAGGAGAALSLLLLERVDHVVINDYDPAIFAFWKAITEQSNDFIKLVQSTPITVEEWERQKIIYRAADTSDLLVLGFATFFLNRTNRSGILNAGPIGGKEQQGIWKIDARFNRDSLVDKLKLIALYSERITVLNDDGAAVIERFAKSDNSFFYVDPPYFRKGADLYLNAFKLADHQKLAETLIKHVNAKWLLSYDDESVIRELYRDQPQEVFSLKYSAHHESKYGMELMIFSDGIDYDEMHIRANYVKS